jgi:hypothetical protein
MTNYKLPYFRSLNYQMSKYMSEVKDQYILDQLQAANVALLREVDMNRISKAEASFRLEELKKSLRAKKDLSLASTNSPEIPIVEDKANIYAPPTAAEYENMINKEPKMTLTKNNNAYVNKELVGELKQKLQEKNKDKLLNNLENELKPLFVEKIQKNNKAKVLQELVSNNIKKEQLNKYIDGVLNDIINKSVLESKKNKNVILKDSDAFLGDIIKFIENKNLTIKTMKDLNKVKREVETSFASSEVETLQGSSMAGSPTSINYLPTHNIFDNKKYVIAKIIEKGLLVKDFGINKRTTNKDLNNIMSVLNLD